LLFALETGVIEYVCRFYGAKTLRITTHSITTLSIKHSIIEPRKMTLCMTTQNSDTWKNDILHYKAKSKTVSFVIMAINVVTFSTTTILANIMDGIRAFSRPWFYSYGVSLC
jgi:hypothetical protein